MGSVGVWGVPDDIWRLNWRVPGFEEPS